MSPPSSRLLVIGINHRTSPPDLRDRFGLLENDNAVLLEALRRQGVGDAVLMVTCDRIELATHDPHAEASFVPLLAQSLGCTEREIAAPLQRYEGDAALRHLFAVASALDSQVIGEPQVLGQMKAAERTAAELGLVGPALERAFSGAFACARRVRRETRIAERPVTLAAAALDLARGIFGDLARCSALLLGPSEMGELMAERFRGAGLARLALCGPPERTASAARRFSAHNLPLDELDAALAAADIVIAALGSGRAVLTAPRVVAALRRRPLRPIFIIDTAVPGDAEPAVDALDGVFLYDLGDLERAALSGRVRRLEAATEAWRIVEEELASFGARQAEQRAVPAVVALRRHFEHVRATVMAERGVDADVATRLLVNRLLHDPSETLRDLAADGDANAAMMEEVLRRLFRLGADEPEE